MKDRPLVELCVEPAGLCGRCTGVAVPLRVVPSPTGLPSKDSALLSSRDAGLLEPPERPKGSQGRGSLVGCRLWGRTESDTTEAT